MIFKKDLLKQRLKYLRHMSIRTKLLILFISLSVLPAVTFGIISYSKSITAIEAKTSKYSLQILEQTSENINQMLKSYEMICYNISKNSDIIESMNNNDKEFDIDSILLIKHYLQNIITSRRDEIASIFLYSAGRKEIREGDALATAILNFYKSKLYRNTVEADGNIVWTTSSEDPEDFRSKGFLTVSRLLKDPVTGENKGIIVIFIKEKTIEDMYNKYLLEKGGVIFVLDKMARVISHPNKDLIGKEILGNIDSRVLKHDNGYYLSERGSQKELISFWTLNKKKGWKIISVIPRESLMDMAKEIRNTTIFITLSSILISVIGAYVISSKVSKRIINVAKDMDNVEREYPDDFISKLGENINLANIKKTLKVIKSVEDKAVKSILENNWDRAHNDSSNDEVDKISRSLNTMTRKIKTLVEEVYKQKLLKREAELRSLQSQINPHFLYNSLEKIKGIAELEGSPKAAEMITALGKLFRLNLSRGNEIITINQEIEHIQLYLSLQSLGRKSKYEVDINIEEDILDCVIIKMTLQPIVENAILHGLERSFDRNKIGIKGFSCGNQIIIEVIDNGKGMNQETLKRLKQFISVSGTMAVESDRKFGIALKNVNERIQLYFGKEYGIFIESEEDIGTTITIKIPMIFYEEWGDTNEVINS